MSQNDPTHLFSENPPPPAAPQLAPKRPDSGIPPYVQEAKKRAADSVAGAFSLADQIRNAKQNALLTFTLKYTIPGQTLDVRVKRPDILFLARSGRLPSELQQIIGKFFVDPENADPDEAEAQVRKAMQADIGLLMDVLNATAIAGFIDPPLCPTPQPGETTPPGYLAVDEIDMQDLLDFFSWCQGTEAQATEALAVFPDEGPGAGLEARPDSEAVRSATFANPPADRVGYPGTDPD